MTRIIPKDTDDDLYHYSLTTTHSLYPSWPAPEPAISLSGTMVPMYADGRA